MNFLGNIWNTIKSAGGAAIDAGKGFWNQVSGNAPPSQMSQGTQMIADAAHTAGNLAGDVLSLFGPKTTTVLPANQPYGTDFSGQVYSPSPSQLSMGATAEGMTDSKGNPVPNSSTAPSGITSKNIPNPYNPTPVNVGGMSFAPAPSSPAPKANQTLSGGSSSFTPSSPAPIGFMWNSKGQAVVAPTAQSGSSGTGTSIPGGGEGNVTPPQGASGSAGGGISASLGAGSAIQGGSDTSTVADTGSNNNKKNTQQISQPGAAAWIPSSNPYQVPSGLTQTQTPQGGTAYQDKSGNMYVPQNGGYKLVTSLPGTSTPAYNFNGQSYNLTPASGIQTQLGQGRVYTLQDAQGNTQYFVQTGQGFAPVIGGNLNGQTTGQLTGQLGAVDPNIQISSQAQGNVPVGPQANQQSNTPTANGTQPVNVTNTNAPSFNAGGVGNPIDIGSLTSNPAGDAANLMNSVASGQVDPTTIPQFNASLQNQINGIVSSMTSQSGIDPSTNYNIDPSIIANGDQNISNAISGDMGQFNQINQQFGVPQLQQQYLGAITTVGGINAAVSRVTQEILNDPNIPKGLAQNQISYLANKANELLTPYQAQADTVKAQLQYATSNMRAYYSNYWRGQSLQMNQFKTLLANNAPIDPNQWGSALGIDPSAISAMSQYKTALNLAGLNTKESTAQANNMLMNLASSPSATQSIIQGITSGMLPPDFLTQLPSRTGGGALLRTVLAEGLANSGANLTQLQANYKASQAAASTANSAGVILPLTYIKSVIPNMADLKTISNSIDRTNFPAINSAEFATLLNTGDTKTVSYLTTVNEVADQIAKILQGGGAGGTSDAKLSQAQALFQTGFSKDQLNAVIDSLTPLLQNRVQALTNITPNYTGGSSGGGSASGSGTGGGTSAAPDATFQSLQNLGFQL